MANSLRSFTAFTAPPARMVLPPTLGIFSTTMTFAPFCCAEIAAARPAPPAPMTTTSVVSSSSAAFSTTTSFFSISAVVSTPPFSRAALTVARIASEVRVAPATASTLMVFSSTIAAGMLATAESQIPGVSLHSSTVTALMEPSSARVTVTVTAPTPPIWESPVAV